MQPISIEIFKTNLEHPKDAEVVVSELSLILPNAHINFDLEDCDKVLRIECNNIPIQLVEATLLKLGYNCHCIN